MSYEKVVFWCGIITSVIVVSTFRRYQEKKQIQEMADGIMDHMKKNPPAHWNNTQQK